MSDAVGPSDGDVGDLPTLDSHPGPARPLLASRAEAIVDEALARARGKRPSLSRRRHLLLVATLGLLAAAAAASAMYVALRSPEEPPAPTAPAARGTSARAAAAGAPSAASRPRAAGSAPGEPGRGSPADGAPGLAVPAPAAVEPDRAAPLRPGPPAAPESGPRGAATPGAAVAGGPAAARERAPDLLAEANRLRAERRWAEAEKTYARVMRASPGSEEAYAATVAAASLRLERLGDPRGALRLYDEALDDRPGGTLAEEAAFGVAECHRAAGEAAREADALRAFLAAHPGAAMAARATARLRELETGTAP